MKYGNITETNNQILTVGSGDLVKGSIMEKNIRLDLWFQGWTGIKWKRNRKEDNPEATRQREQWDIIKELLWETYMNNFECLKFKLCIRVVGIEANQFDRDHKI